MVVRHGRGLHDDAGFAQVGDDGVVHFESGAHVHHAHAVRLRQLHRARYQDYFARRAGGRFGQRITHLAAGTVGNEAHRIERLLRGTGGDENSLAFQIARCAKLKPATTAAILSGSASRPGPVVPQASKPSSGSTMMCPRLRSVVRFSCVAGWVHMLLFIAGASTTRPVNARYMVVRKSSAKSVCQACQQIGCGRRDDQYFVVLRDGDVFDGARKRVFRASRSEQTSNDFVSGETRKRQRRDEPLGCVRHHHLDAHAALHQRPGQLRGFVSGDSATHAQHHVHMTLCPKRSASLLFWYGFLGHHAQ